MKLVRIFYLVRVVRVVPEFQISAVCINVNYLECVKVCVYLVTVH